MATDPEAERQRLVRPGMDLKPVGQRPAPWSCACDVKKKHREPWHCLSTEAVAQWRAEHPEATVSDQGAKALAWLTSEFGPHRFR